MNAARTAASRIGAIARRDATIELSYSFRLVVLFIGTFASAFIAYYVSELVGEADRFSTYDGSYFDYVVVGVGLVSYATLAVGAFTSRVTSEQNGGTFEVLLAGDIGVGTLLAGGFVVPLAITTIEVVVLIGLGVGLVGVGLSPAGVLLAVPVLVLSVACFCSFGITAAALVVLVKRGDPLSGPLSQATLVLSGVIFPIELFPGWLQVLCRLTPGYWGVRGLRQALLTDDGWAGIVDELAVLALFAVVLLPVASWLFRGAVRQAKRLGVLATY